MKKRTLLSMLLMLTMMLSLVGCGSDEKKPTSTDTAVNGTEATKDVAEKPTEVETPTPEPEKNVITLMSADGKKVIHEINIPNGYKVVSDKKGSKIELTKDDNALVKIEIYSGFNSDVMSTIADATDELRYSREDFIEEWSGKLSVDAKDFNNPVSNAKGNVSTSFAVLTTYPEQLNLEGRSPEERWDVSKHTSDETYPISHLRYWYATGEYEQYLNANETFTIKITRSFSEEQFDKTHTSFKDDTLQEKLSFYENTDEMEINDIYLALFHPLQHKCEHCNLNK